MCHGPPIVPVIAVDLLNVSSRASRMERQDNGLRARGYGQASSEGAPWLPLYLRERGGPGQAAAVGGRDAM